MGIFTNYKKKIEEESKVWEKDLNQYNESLKPIKNNIANACICFNQEVATLNSERSSLKEQINKLYYFLKDFGKIGDKITPFNFVNESWQKNIDIDSIVNPESVGEENSENGDLGLGAVAASVGAVALSTVAATTFPLLTPIAASTLVFPDLFDRGNKDDFLKYQTLHNEALLRYEKNLESLNNLIKTINLATEIAKLYYGTICTVKEAISETVIPELSGIKAFLYATSIANKVAENNTLTHGIEPVDILEIQGTQYDAHYQFLKNTVDYYTLIVKIFTQPVLTQMLEDNKITNEEHLAFKNHIRQIENKRTLLNENSLFTKEG